MAYRGFESLLGALGFTREDGRLYDLLQPLSGQTLERMADSAARPAAEVDALLVRLEDIGLAHREDGNVFLLPFADAVAVSLARHAEQIRVAHEQLVEIARSVPPALAAPSRADGNGVLAIDGEVVPDPLTHDELRRLVLNSSGDIRWFRPDTWTRGGIDSLTALLRAVLERGGRVRVLYPTSFVAEFPQYLLERHQAGEEIRLVPEVPTRAYVIGSTAAVIPEPFGGVETGRVMLRQPTLVRMVAAWFDDVWAHAQEPRFDDGKVRIEDARRLLLELLASGAGDEAVARRMGLGLRTVRRRVADLMDELGVESRFALGVEASRRGWL